MNPKPITTHLFFIYASGKLAAWSATPPKSVKRLRLHAEDSITIQSTSALEMAAQDAIDRLKSDGKKVGCVHWITTSPEQSSLLKSKLFNAEADTWQILNWQWLSQRFVCDVDPWQAISPLEGQILPWLSSANKAIEQQKMQKALEQDHQNKSDVLRQERADIEQQNEQLKVQNMALQSVDAENLVRFLPALFPRVFTVLGATDLALLCGKVEPLAITNPYPEPSEETLHILQKDFRNLPQPLQKEIVGLVARLPQRKNLRPRPEMRRLITELEAN